MPGWSFPVLVTIWNFSFPTPLGNCGLRHAVFFSKFSCSYSFTHLCSCRHYSVCLPPPLIRRKNSNRVEYNVHFSSYVGTFSIFPLIFRQKKRATDHQISSSKRFFFLFNFQKTHFSVDKWFYSLFWFHKWLCSPISFYVIIMGWQKNSLIYHFYTSDYNHFLLR